MELYISPTDENNCFVFWKDWPPICRAGEKAERPVIVGILEYLRGADLWFLTKACHTFVLDHWLSLSRGRSSACSFNAAALLDLRWILASVDGAWGQSLDQSAEADGGKYQICATPASEASERAFSLISSFLAAISKLPRVCGSNMHFSSCASLECSIKSIQNDN